MGSDPADVDCQTESQEATKAVTDAQVVVKALLRLVDQHAHLSGAAKDALAKLEPRIRHVKDRIEEYQRKLREQVQKVTVRVMLHEAELKVQETEELLKKVSEAEVPCLDGEVCDADATTAILTFEAAVIEAQTVVGSSKSFIAMKRIGVKRLTEASASSCSEALSRLQGRIDDAARKLTGLRTSLNERKKALTPTPVSQDVGK